MPDQNFLDFVVQLVKLGGLGIGALIFVLMFIILFRNQQADTRTAKLRTQFLSWGAGFAIVALLTSTATSFFQRPAGPASSYRLGVTLSPSFEEAQLPNPDIVLMPAGTHVEPEKAVMITSDSTLAIQVRGVVQSVKLLKESTSDMLKTNETLTNALQASTAMPMIASAAPDGAGTGSASVRDGRRGNSGASGAASGGETASAGDVASSGDSATAGDRPPAPTASRGPITRPSPVPRQAVRITPTELRRIQETQRTIGKNLESGDFSGAAQSSARMRAMTSTAVKQ